MTILAHQNAVGVVVAIVAVISVVAVVAVVAIIVVVVVAIVAVISVVAVILVVAVVIIPKSAVVDSSYLSRISEFDIELEYKRFKFSWGKKIKGSLNKHYTKVSFQKTRVHRYRINNEI